MPREIKSKASTKPLDPRAVLDDPHVKTDAPLESSGATPRESLIKQARLNARGAKLAWQNGDYDEAAELWGKCLNAKVLTKDQRAKMALNVCKAYTKVGDSSRADGSFKDAGAAYVKADRALDAGVKLVGSEGFNDILSDAAKAGKLKEGSISGVRSSLLNKRACANVEEYKVMKADSTAGRSEKLDSARTQLDNALTWDSKNTQAQHNLLILDAAQAPENKKKRRFRSFIKFVKRLGSGASPKMQYNRAVCHNLLDEPKIALNVLGDAEEKAFLEGKDKTLGKIIELQRTLSDSEEAVGADEASDKVGKPATPWWGRVIKKVGRGRTRSKTSETTSL